MVRRFSGRRVASRAVAATPRTVTIVGAPLDLGQGRRGVDMGPSAIRYAGLEERLTSFGCRVTDRGNLLVPEPEALAVEDANARFLPEILDACAELAALVGDVVSRGGLPLVLGGDHSVALGTLAGLRAAAGEPGGVIWIDAHGDLNTPRRVRRATSTGCRSRPRSALPAQGSSTPACPACGRAASGRARRRPLTRSGGAGADPGERGSARSR